MVVARSSVNRAVWAFWLCVPGPGQTETVTQDPPRQHQRGDGGKAARQADPDANALPVPSEGEPGTDSEPNPPIADQREDQRPAGLVKPAQHAGPDNLCAID